MNLFSFFFSSPVLNVTHSLFPELFCRRPLPRLLEEEATKRAELEQIHLHQQRAISETEAEKQELEKEGTAKENALQAAMLQLEQLESERQGALEQYQVRHALGGRFPGLKIHGLLLD
jgi:hypothetical protein